MSAHQFNWTEGKLDKGFASYAEHLGLDPSQAVFMNSLVVNPLGSSRRLQATDDLEGRSRAYVLAVSGPGATALHNPLTRAHQEYVTAYLADGGTLVPVEQTAPGRLYPEASIIAGLESRLDTPEVRKLIDGKVLINSYPTEEVEALAQKAGGRTLMPHDTFIGFVGKEYLHNTAARAGYDVPPGVVIERPEDASLKSAAFRQVLADAGMNPDQTKVWVKPSSLSGGQGISNWPGATPDNLAGALQKVAVAYKNCGYFGERAGTCSDPGMPFSGIDYFVPVVMEADVGYLLDVRRKIEDVGISAILSDKGVTFIEATPFTANEGEYEGSHLSQPHEQAGLLPAKIAADKLFKQMQQEGYRGFVGVDAMLLEKQDGTVSAALNDINTRLTGATPLIALSHKAEARTGYRPHAYTAQIKLPMPEGCSDAFEAVADFIGGNLYKGAQTGYTGVVPVVVDVPPGQPEITVKVVALGRDAQHLASLRKALSSKPE